MRSLRYGAIFAEHAAFPVALFSRGQTTKHWKMIASIG